MQQDRHIWSRSGMLFTSGFMDDVTSAHKFQEHAYAQSGATLSGSTIAARGSEVGLL